MIRGRAAEPTYLWLHDGVAELRPAGHLWGKTTSEVDDVLKHELGDDKIQVAQAGPAGEKLVRLAAIMNMANRANGRTGMGAVMGSKNLKAIVARGTSKKLPLADAAVLNQLARAGAAEIPNNPDVLGLRTDGTAGVLEWQHAAGTLPTFNYNAGQFDRYEAISGQTMTATILADRDTCYACAVRCKRVVETEWQGRPVEARHGGPEYETLGVFGSYCGVDDLPAISLANKICNEHGLDTIGTGATVAWTMECFEGGLLTESDIGFPAPFGDASAMVRLTEMLARREGFGDILANGSRRAADLIGKGHDLLITVKGAEAPAHMPQAKRSLGVIYAVNPFGADHQSSEHDPMIEDGAAELSLDRLKLLGFDAALEFGSLGAGEGPLRPADPAVLLVPRHGLAVPVRVGPGVDAVRAAGDGRFRAGRHRLERLRSRRAHGDRRAAAEPAACVQRRGGHRTPRGSPAGQDVPAAHRDRAHGGSRPRPRGAGGRP